MAEWKVNPVVLYAPDGDDIDSAWQKEIAQVEAIIGYLNRLRTGDAGSGLSVPDAVAYSIKIDTSTNPATIYMRNAENNAYIKLGTLEPHFGITGDDIGSVDAEGFGKMTFGKAEDRPSTANPKDLYWAYDEKKVYIWDNGGWDTMLSMDYKDIEHLDENVVLKTNIALSGPNKILLLDDDGKANVDITGSPARINGQLVKVDGLAGGDVLQYDAKSQSWKNAPKDELTEARDVSSTGTPGKIVRADTYGNMNANAKVIATKPITLATGLKDGDALVYDKTADAFLNTPVATVNSSGIADINISGNAAKVAGVPVKTDDNLGDGQTLVYRADRNAFVNESKSTVGAGQSLYIKNGDDVIATYSGDKVADVDISKAVYDTKYFRQPNTEYAVGDRVLVKALQNGLQLECKTAGTTSVKELDCGTAKLGDAVADGSAVWTVVRPQLTTDSIASIAALKPSVDKLPYYTGTETAGLTDFTDAARTLLSKNTAADMRDVLEMDKGASASLATPRKIELTGNVTGSANFDGSKDIQIATSLADAYLPLSGGEVTGAVNFAGGATGNWTGTVRGGNVAFEDKILKHFDSKQDQSLDFIFNCNIYNYPVYLVSVGTMFYRNTGSSQRFINFGVAALYPGSWDIKWLYTKENHNFIDYVGNTYAITVKGIAPLTINVSWKAQSQDANTAFATTSVWVKSIGE